jgi:hypothetical protein
MELAGSHADFVALAVAFEAKQSGVTPRSIKSKWILMETGASWISAKEPDYVGFVYDQVPIPPWPSLII